jgi:hypothetical protein
MSIKVRFGLIALAAPMLAPVLSAGPFQFNTLVRLGAPSASLSNWEVAVGDNDGSTGQSGSIAWWASGASRQFQVIYNRPANNLQMRIYANNGASYAFMNYTPTGTPAAADAVWTLPASSFFVSAQTGANVYTGVTVSNLALTGLSGALSILSPIQQTTMQAGSGPFQPSQTVTQSAGIVFRGDSNGSWRLQGFVTMSFFGLSGGGHQNRLQFGVSAVADTANPEPRSWVLLLTGLVALIWQNRQRLRGQAQRPAL